MRQTRGTFAARGFAGQKAPGEAVFEGSPARWHERDCSGVRSGGTHTRATRRGPGTIRHVTERDTPQSDSEKASVPEDESVVVQYGEVTPARWYDEGNVEFDAWTLTVEIGTLRRTYWFQTELGAVKFRAERKAG